MFKPVQFSSQYTYDIMYKRGQAANFRSVEGTQLAKGLLPQVIRSSAISGVSAQGITYEGENRLMVDDQRGGDANLALQAMKGAEEVGRVTQAMLADERLALRDKPPAEVSAILANPIARAEFLLAQNRAIKTPDKTDHIQFYFANGENGEPVLERVAVQTRSPKLLNLQAEAPSEAAAPEEGAEKAPQQDGALNPLAALQAAFGLPAGKITVSPFIQAETTPAPAAKLP